MTKKDMKKVAETLGVEMGETFCINSPINLYHYKITEEGFLGKISGSPWDSWKPADLDILVRILIGELTIAKALWEPAKGERYCCPSVGAPEKSSSWEWRNDECDRYRYKRGLVFKTRDEAVELTKKMLAVVNESRK